MITDFINKFTDKKFEEIKKIRRKYFIVSKKITSIREKIKLNPEAIGTFLGEEKKGRFFPSLALLELLAKQSNRKVFIDKKSEWLFLCNRDVMGQSIIKVNMKSGLVLVQNEADENLGYGKIVGDINSKDDTIVIKNILDRGDFLRRE